MLLRRVCLTVFLTISFILTAPIFAQSELAATLEVLDDGVEVRRVNTEQWIAVNVEAIVGVGDEIRTGESGRARIIFFADGTDTELTPNTLYRIEQFEGDESRFTISASVLSGQTIQRLNRLLDADSEYNVNTPGMELAARGTEFRVRVEDSGRAAMLVSEGNVAADAEGESEEVPSGFGIRAAVGETLSDVVAATSFEELDAALDGCTVSVTTPDDVQLNVRSGTSLESPLLGTIPAQEINRFFGITESGGWYRIPFGDGFGWVLSSSATVEAGCAGLRTFPDNYSEGGSSEIPEPAAIEESSDTSSD